MLAGEMHTSETGLSDSTTPREPLTSARLSPVRSMFRSSIT